MKITVLIDTNPFYSNSASSNRWRSLLDGLLKNGISVHLLITGGFNTLEEWRNLGLSGFHKGMNYTYLNLLFHHNIWLRRLNRYILNPVIKRLQRGRILSVLRDEMPDITWSSAEYDHFQLIFWLKSRFNNTKYFLEMSEFLDIHRFNTGNILQRKKGDQQQAFFEQKSFYTYDGIALMTRALLRHYESFPGKKPEFLHLPMTVDLDRFEQPAQASIVQNLKKPYIAFIGVMNNQKDGVDILINAFAAIEKDFHKHHLYLFGPYNYDTPGHLKQIKALNLEEKIFWHGEVSRDEVPSILVHADVLTLPRPASKQAQGGFPTKLGEYLASSRPVCVTNVGEIPDYLQDGKSAFFAEPGSSESFASAMRRALSDQENAILVGANGRKVAEKHFNKDIQSKILCDFLQNLLHDDQQ